MCSIGRISTKQHEQNGSQDAAAVHKQAVMAELQAEEDTFRGVHLDPNAHHWDEVRFKIIRCLVIVLTGISDGGR